MIKVEGVPESLNHQQVLDAVTALGFDPKRLFALRITTRGVEADVHIGPKPVVRYDRDESAMHTITYVLPPAES